MMIIMAHCNTRLIDRYNTKGRIDHTAIENGEFFFITFGRRQYNNIIDII